MALVNPSVPDLDLEYLNGCRLEKEVFRSLIFNKDYFEAAELPTVFAILLCGPSGCGKTTLIKCAAGEYASHGYEYLAANITKDSPFTEADAYSVLSILDRNNCFLHIRHPEKLHDVDALEQLLSAASEKEHALIVVCAVKNEADMDFDVSSLFTALKLRLPDYNDRLEYFSEELSDFALSPANPSAIAAILAKGTEDAGYSDLDSIAVISRLRIKLLLQNNASGGSDMQTLWTNVANETVDEYSRRKVSESCGVVPVIQPAQFAPGTNMQPNTAVNTPATAKPAASGGDEDMINILDSIDTIVF